MNEFQTLFEGLLRDSLKEDASKSKQINPERFEALSKVYNEFSALIENGTKPRLKLHPAVGSGAVSAKVSTMELSGEKLQRIKELLTACDTFAVVPLTDGALEVSVTAQHVFLQNE